MIHEYEGALQFCDFRHLFDSIAIAILRSILTETHCRNQILFLNRAHGGACLTQFATQKISFAFLYRLVC